MIASINPSWRSSWYTWGVGITESATLGQTSATSIPTSCSKQGQLRDQTRQLRVLSSWVLNPLKMETTQALRAAWSSAWWSPVTFLSLYAAGNSFNLWILPLILMLCTAVKSPAAAPQYPPRARGRMLVQPPDAVPHPGWTSPAPALTILVDSAWSSPVGQCLCLSGPGFRRNNCRIKVLNLCLCTFVYYSFLFLFIEQFSQHS